MAEKTLRLLKDTHFWLFLILLLAAGLRFYRLPDYLQFLGDQGRDVLVVKRMIVDHKWTLLGPSASVGGFFTGPIYYYFMLPFLWLFNLDPVGPAVLSALFGVATVALIYWFCVEIRSPRAGLIAAFLVAVSPKMVEISRYSWNPNPVPFFALSTIFLLYLAAVRKRKIFTLFAGVGLGIMFQLHYMTTVFLPLGGLVAILIFPRKEIIWHLLFLATGFSLGNFLFLFFEVRHNFPNLRSVLEFVTRGGKTVSPRHPNFLILYNDILHRLYEMTLSLKGWPAYIFLYSSLLAFFAWVVRIWRDPSGRAKAILLLVWLFVGAFGVGSYRGSLYDHYFVYLYPLPFIFLGVAGDYLASQKWTTPILLVGLIVLSYFAVKNLYFWQEPNQMLSQIQRIDRTVLEYASGQPYNLALISTTNSDFAYRYYLEIWGKSPIVIENSDIDPERKSVTATLVVICEDKVCKPLGHPLWEIAGFGRAEIAEVRDGPAGIKIYKLVPYEGRD